MPTPPSDSKMKFSTHLPVLLAMLLVLVSSVTVDDSKVFVNSSNSIRLPEHTCHKAIGPLKCKPEICSKLSKVCSKEPKGTGEYRAAMCLCTFFCLRPPK